MPQYLPATITTVNKIVTSTLPNILIVEHLQNIFALYILLLGDLPKILFNTQNLKVITMFIFLTINSIFVIVLYFFIKAIFYLSILIFFSMLYTNYTIILFNPIKDCRVYKLSSDLVKFMK